MISTVTLSFRYLQSDIVKAWRAHFASRLRLWLDIPAVVLLAASGIYSLRFPGWQWVSLACLVGSGALALILVAALVIIPSMIFRREPKFRDEYSLTFSPEGIHFSTVHIDSKLSWSMYSRALVDARSYVLYYGSTQFTVIPKRVFQSTEQREAFEELLAQNVPQVVRKDA